jgi:tetratricopeptide (TPR) repeat protein
VPCQASESFDKAKLLYQKGQYTESLEFIEAELKANPKNAAAHYLFGNVLVTKKALPEAIREYQSAAVLDPTGPSGLYSKQALSKLVPPSKAEAAAPALDQGQNKDGGQDKDKGKDRDKDEEKSKGRDHAGDDSEESALKHSVRTTSAQTTESGKAIEEECARKIAEIKKVADQKVKALQDEMNNQIAANGSFRSRYYDPEPLNAPIRQDYTWRIQVVRDDSDRRCSEMQAIYKQRLLAIEEAGLDVDKAFSDSGRTSGIKLSPLGTNLHVRNYESSDEASGHAVPLVAEPGKIGGDMKQDKSSKIPGASNSAKTRDSSK